MNASTRGFAKGFGLIEVLIAVLVLSIGLLGLARLQMTGLRSAHSATQRMDAINLSYDIIDRMRANRLEANAGKYVTPLGGTCSCAGTPKTDVDTWQASVATLPTGKGQIDFDTTTRLVTITVQWAEPWDTEGGGTSQVQLRSQM
jgi:type IV pilus assembly protein PilV